MKKINSGIHSIYIGNLKYHNTEDQILGLFKSFGYIKHIKIMREGKLNKSKGFAFVDMVVLQDAQKAIESLDGSLFCGRTLKVKMANTQNYKAPKKPIKILPLSTSKKSFDPEIKKSRRRKKHGNFQEIFTKNK